VPSRLSGLSICLRNASVASTRIGKFFQLFI
jgi:hypothetical protein